MRNLVIKCPECGFIFNTGDLTIDVKCPDCKHWIEVNDESIQSN